MVIRQHERQIEELSVQLKFTDDITASGADMTLPAAADDLNAWLDDRRKFLPVQYDDWQSIIGEFGESCRVSGTKLLSIARPHVDEIKALLPRLFVLTPAADAYRIDPKIRTSLAQHAEALARTLRSDQAIIAAWQDLVRACDRVRWKVERVSFLRDCLWAIARSRNMDTGNRGFARLLASVVTDDADTIQRVLDDEAGNHRPFELPNRDPSGLALWERVEICERLIVKPPRRGNCIVWLRLRPASIRFGEVSHGQITFYDASYLSSIIDQPQFAKNLKVQPTEILTPPEYVYLEEGEKEWEDDREMAYARVVLDDVELHRAENEARALIEAMKSINHVRIGTWEILYGSIIFIDGRRASLSSWGWRIDPSTLYSAEGDEFARDVEIMEQAHQSLTSHSLSLLKSALEMSNALKAARSAGDEATVMAAVRAIEHVNVWSTGGALTWDAFASRYLKKGAARIRTVEYLAYFAINAVDGVPDRRPSYRITTEFIDIKRALNVHVVGRPRMFSVRSSIDYLPQLSAIYENHWLTRGLHELTDAFESGEHLNSLLSEHCGRFDKHLSRLRRVRNAAIHGGPVTAAACQSVATFAYNLGHQCVNESLRAILLGIAIPDHLDAYRLDHIRRFDAIKFNGAFDELFVDVPL